MNKFLYHNMKNTLKDWLNVDGISKVTFEVETDETFRKDLGGFTFRSLYGTYKFLSELLKEQSRELTCYSTCDDFESLDYIQLNLIIEYFDGITQIIKLASAERDYQDAKNSFIYKQDLIY